MVRSKINAFVIAALLSIAIPMNVEAAKTGYIGAEAEYGFSTRGKNVQYTLDDTGIMTITGQRKMQDTSSSISFLGGDSNKVKEIVINEGVTNVGDYAFSCLYNLEKVTLPKSIESIGESAFYKCESLKSIVIPEGVRIIKKVLLTTA